MADINTSFEIPKDGYLTMDALTLKQYIKDRLNEKNVFTDQNYEGSYISTVNEIIAYVFNLLMFYLNRTSTESMFTESQLYENMNRIVKMLDYAPIGKQTASTTFGLSGTIVDSTTTYTIPRYSYISTGNANYSIIDDITIVPSVSGFATFDDEVGKKLLYQGSFVEYPLYSAVGNINEVIYLAPGDNVLIDHFNIDVYVKESNSSEWYKWERTQTLYLENGNARAFEIRLNENTQYEIKFGDGINGKKLEANDLVSIYYIESLGTEGEISNQAINNRSFKLFVSETLNEILSNISERTGDLNPYTTASEIGNFVATNTSNSTYYQAEETVESIRKNAPGVFRSQYRVVTKDDYSNYIKANFANIIHDAVVVDNWTYLSEQMKYYYEDIGLKDPNNISNLLYNQVNFADACNFNNIYITIVPKTVSNTKTPNINLSPAQKELVISTLDGVKTLTTDTIILDPVYIAVDMCVSRTGNNLEDSADTELVIIKDNSRRDNKSIVSDVINIFTEYFDRSNINLGHVLDISSISSQILNVAGVKTFYTASKTDPLYKYNGLSLIAWNPIYTTDNKIITENTIFSYFKYLFLNNKDAFINKIRVEDSTSKIFETLEY